VKSAGRNQQNRRPTIIDVAREANVGIMTVSRVINNHESVKASTRAKVMSAISKVGYRPNDAARMLKGMRARMIGFIVPDLSDFFSDCFHATQRVAMLHGYQTMVVATGRSAAVENQQLDLIGSNRVAGLVIVTSGGDIRRMRTLQENGIPVVALDRPIVGLNADAVLTEYREGAELGVRHLLEHGHKSVACVGFEGGAFTVSERMEGYRKIMRSGGLKIQTYDGIQSLQQMEELIGRWMRAKERPTAIFAAQRISAIRLIQALHRYQVRIPQDMAVVGFDDFELAQVLGTPLTVVSQSPSALAQSAAELLFKQIEHAQQYPTADHQPAKILYPTTLVIRASCGCKLTS
jgi:LacI family transcriptional regulator